MRPTDLALILGTGKANLSKIAHRLQEAGLVVRVRATGDERSVLLALTPAGRAIGERIMRHAQESLDATLADWSAEEVAALRRMLARLARGPIADLSGD
jgi:DNA-binding MarR family transcriptional regulator